MKWNRYYDPFQAVWKLETAAIRSCTRRNGRFFWRGMARIAIIGPGAIGGVMAAWLGKPGTHRIFLCARRQIGKLTVETPNETFELRPAVWTDPAAAEAVDWVLVATKAYAAAATGAWLSRLTAKGAPAAVLQNGVEHRERFLPYLPAERIVPVIVECPAERTEPDLVRQRRRARLIVGDDGAGRSFRDLFAGTEIEVALTGDFTTAAWTKLCLNSAGVLSALLLQPAGIMHDEDIAEAARNIVRECIAVGRAQGAVLPDSLADKVVETYRASPRDSLNSIHADRLAGRPTEIDARNGVIVRLGRKHSIATPCNEMAVALLEAQARAASGK